MRKNKVIKQLTIEGLAGQMHSSAHNGYYTWWHVTKEEIREKYRQQAREKIEAYEKMCKEQDKNIMYKK